MFYSSSQKHTDKSNNIFLSYCFAKEDAELAEGVKNFLLRKGYNVIDGKADKLGSISKTIVDKIKNSDIIIIIMTKKDKKENGLYTTPTWLLEEKAVAITLNKKTAILVEEGVDCSDIGGLQGDDQRFNFNRNNFLSKILELGDILGNAA